MPGEDQGAQPFSVPDSQRFPRLNLGHGALELYGIYASHCVHPLLLMRNAARTCVVALPGFDGDAFARGPDFHRVIASVAVVAVRPVCQGVLVASFLGYPRIEPFYGCALDGVINIAAGVICVVEQARELSL